MNLSPSELKRLRRFIEAHAEHFALALVRVPQWDVREELRRWTAGVAEEQQRALRVIDGTGRTDREVWEQIASGAADGAITMLTGLDDFLVSPASELPTLLNRQREKIAQLLPGPVLFLIGEMALDQFLVRAPDLADWYAASFAFEREPGMVERLSGSSLVSGEGKPPLSRRFVRERIGLLQGQLQNSDLGVNVQVAIWLQLARLHSDLIAARPEENETLDVGAALQAALDAAHRAEELLRKLPTRDAAVEDRLGDALILQSNALADLGRHGEARDKAEEAVKLYRKLSAESAAFEADLALALGSYANRLSELGLADVLVAEAREALERNRKLLREALAASEESLAIYKSLAQRDPHVSRMYLVSALRNYANALGDLGREEQELQVQREALEISRELVAQRQDVSFPELALLLNDYAGTLLRLGRYGEARMAASESLPLLRQASVTYPDVFTVPLARTLGVLSMTTPDLAAACDFARQALETLREPLRDTPETHRLHRRLTYLYAEKRQATKSQSPPPKADDHSPS